MPKDPGRMVTLFTKAGARVKVAAEHVGTAVKRSKAVSDLKVARSKPDASDTAGKKLVRDAKIRSAVRAGAAGLAAAGGTAGGVAVAKKKKAAGSTTTKNK